MVRKNGIALVLLMFVLFLCAACGTTPSSGTNNTGDDGTANDGTGDDGTGDALNDVSDIEEAAAQAAVDSTVAISEFQQIAAPIQEEVFSEGAVRQFDLSGLEPEALEARLEQIFAADDAEIEVTLSLITYTIAFNNMDLYDSGIIVNGSIGLTPTISTDPAITIVAEGFQIGELTLTVNLTVARSGENQVITDGTVTGVFGETTVAVTLTDVTVTRGDDSVTVAGGLSVEVTGLGTLVVTASDVVLTAESLYPVSGTLTFMVNRTEFSVAFSQTEGGTVIATLTGPGGISMPIPLPQIEEA